MKDVLKQIALWTAVLLVILGIMTWLTCAEEIKRVVNREAELRDWQPIFEEHDRADECVGWSHNWRPKLADTQVQFDEAAINGTMQVLNQRAIATEVTRLLTGLGATRVEMSVDALLQCTLIIYIGAIGVAGVVIDISGTGELSVDYSISATGFHIDRTRQAKVWMGSDTGPTHSNEMTAADAWEADAGVGEVVITFGPLSHTCANDDGAGNPLIGPASSISVAVSNHTSGAVVETLARITIDGPTFEHDYTAIRHGYGNNMWVNGDGHEFSFDHESPLGTIGIVGVGKNWYPPYAADFTELGLADWQETTHNAAYDPVLVWVWDTQATCPLWQIGGACAAPPGFYPAPWASDGGPIPAYDYGDNPLDFTCQFCATQLRPNGMEKEPWVGAAWPDISLTDWAGAGAFADGSAAPLPISELHSIFNPYVQQIAPYSAWTFKAGYVREFWHGGLTWLYDRKSLRANLIDVA